MLDRLFKKRVLENKQVQEKQPTPQEPRTENEHGEVIGPIVASIGTSEMHTDESPEWRKALIGSENIDYFASASAMRRAEQRNAGPRTYVLSKIDESPKYSGGYMNCTGVAAVGVDKETGKNISFLTHQDPDAFLGSKKSMFEKDFRELLQEFRARVVWGTEDVMLFGGNHYTDKREKKGRPSHAKDYEDSIETLSRMINEELGIESHVAIGPSIAVGGDVAGLLDAQKRRLYIERDEQFDTTRNESFAASDLKEHAKNWKPVSIREADRRY